MGASHSAEAAIIDGKTIASTIRAEIKGEVDALRAKHGKVPGLAVVIVGDRKDSQTYVRMKRKACEEAGIESFHAELPASASEAEVHADPDEMAMSFSAISSDSPSTYANDTFRFPG